MGKTKREIGSYFESKAAEFLKSRGCEILAANFYCRFGEIDLIVKDGAYIAFCEVKYRKSDKKGLPVEAVTRRKQKTISKCAVYYLTVHGFLHMDVRFDVISVLDGQIDWIQNAFDYCG